MKSKSLYLYLSIVCFVGIILVFVFDGYIGVYDSLVMDNGRFPQTVEPDQWSQDRYDYVRSTGVERGARVVFTYKVENHRFSSYAADVEVSFLHNDEVIAETLTQSLTAEPFGEAEVRWVLDADAFIPAGYPDEQSYNVDVVISRGKVRREVIVNISSLPPKSVLIEPRTAG